MNDKMIRFSKFASIKVIRFTDIYPLPSSMQACPICLTSAKDMAFGCGHMVRALHIDYFCVFSISFTFTFLIRSHIGSIRKCGVVVKLERFSNLSGRSFGLDSPIRLEYL